MDLTPHTVSPDSAYDTYCKSCTRNKKQPVEELDFVKGLAIGLSGILSIGIKNSNLLGMTKFPIDKEQSIWCLIVPCCDGEIRLIYGPLDGVNETIDNIINAMQQDLNDSMTEVQFSSIDQF